MSLINPDDHGNAPSGADFKTRMAWAKQLESNHALSSRPVAQPVKKEKPIEEEPPKNIEENKDSAPPPQASPPSSAADSSPGGFDFASALKKSKKKMHHIPFESPTAPVRIKEIDPIRTKNIPNKASSAPKTSSTISRPKHEEKKDEESPTITNKQLGGKSVEIVEEIGFKTRMAWAKKLESKGVDIVKKEDEEKEVEVEEVAAKDEVKKPLKVKVVELPPPPPAVVKEDKEEEPVNEFAAMLQRKREKLLEKAKSQPAVVAGAGGGGIAGANAATATRKENIPAQSARIQPIKEIGEAAVPTRVSGGASQGGGTSNLPLHPDSAFKPIPQSQQQARHDNDDSSQRSKQSKGSAKQLRSSQGSASQPRSSPTTLDPVQLQTFQETLTPEQQLLFADIINAYETEVHKLKEGTRMLATEVAKQHVQIKKMLKGRGGSSSTSNNIERKGSRGSTASASTGAGDGLRNSRCGMSQGGGQDTHTTASSSPVSLEHHHKVNNEDQQQQHGGGENKKGGKKKKHKGFFHLGR